MILKRVDDSRSNQMPEDTLFAYPPFRYARHEHCLTGASPQ